MQFKRILHLPTVGRTSTISSIPIVYWRDSPQIEFALFRPEERKYFRREILTKVGRMNSTFLFCDQVRHLISEDSNIGRGPLNINV
ncbi:hypothetical protein TNIN_393541 [Trichonephila inaurata madagascariensis]|uniref:Uncharacterized protein n=1 Tax=Trichonephila inaurata madagascariensis TaxID=2747483 RepID=A0A8X7C7C7_9ARAC|nr:hypothetical protein TNIN_393541 [Trichonephila inaurata madagascariensis]